MAQIPDSILNDLRCCGCREFLSCGPVRVLADGGSTCGRCGAKSKGLPADAYEAVASYFLFRCKNWAKHCAYLLNFDDVLRHEQQCAFGSCSIVCSNPSALFKKDNKLDLTQEITVFNVPERLLDILTCTRCEYYLSSPPIFINRDAKNTCHRCFNAKGQKLPVDYVRHVALEKILAMMMFPCVYRQRGCTKFFRFGSDTASHEEDCAYGKVQKKTPKRFTDARGKERGVIETHSGHTYGTITPNSQFFVPQEKVTSNNSFKADPIKVQPNEAQGIFIKQLMNHRENLVENRWRNSKLNSDVLYPPSEPRTPTEKSPSRSEHYSNYSNYAKPNQLEELNQFRNFKNGPITQEPTFSSSYNVNRYQDTNRNHDTTRCHHQDDGYQSFNSVSESPAISDSPRSSDLEHQRSSPLKLNAADLNAFSYNFAGTKAPRPESLASDGGTRGASPVQYNGSFRN